MKRTRRPDKNARRGFTLLELMVTLVLVDVALLALVSTTAFVARTLGAAASQQAAVAAARARLERLASLACSGNSSGESRPGPGMREWWSVSAASADSRLLVDSIQLTTRRGPRMLVLRSRVSC
jgi:prepilin-type N-terminal cleavage/methylation domain-containing protein